MIWRTGLWLLGLTIVCGCSGNESTYEVTGKVTLANGTPLSGGTVVFQPEMGKPGAKGQIQSDGSYELGTYDEDDGAVLGMHQVLVVPQSTPNWDEETQGAPPEVFHPKYRSFANSGLKCEVKDDVVFDIKLDEAPPPPEKPKPKPKRGTRRR